MKAPVILPWLLTAGQWCTRVIFVESESQAFRVSHPNFFESSHDLVESRKLSSHF